MDAAPGSLDALLATHAEGIAALRAALGASLPPATLSPPLLFDSIWLLRYCLSFAGDARAQAVRDCIAWRTENASMLAGVAAGQPPPNADRVAPFIVSALHGAGRGGEPLYIVRAALSDPKGMMSALTPEELLPWFMAQREKAFLLCDEATRTQRRLVKMVSVIVMSDSQFSDFDQRYFSVIARTGKLSEFCFPQVLLKSCSFEPPSFFLGAFALFKPLMSKTMLEKFALCPGRARGGSLADCPFASKMFEASTLPTFLGGTCRCTARGGCICGRPNAQRRPAPAGGPRDASLSVGARDHLDVLLTARAAGALLTWEFEVASQGVEFSAVLQPDEGAEVVLVAKDKRKAEEGRLSGRVRVPKAGLVRVRFDNAYSLLTSKQLRHVSMAVEEPSEAQEMAAPAL